MLMKEFYNVNEVAKMFNITTNKIRYYEEKGLIKPLRDDNSDYRKFTEEDILRLQAILLYRCIGLSIKDIKDILDDSSNSNYLNHFNKQWEIVNDELHKLINMRDSIGTIIDKLYESNDDKFNDNILYIIESTKKLNELRDNWKDKWSFDSWASSYDEDVAKDITGVKMYKNYNHILDEVFKAATNINKKDMSILDIGVGTGNLAGRFLKENYDVTGIDQSREMLNVAKQKYPNLKVRLGEFLKIPFNDKSFDVIVSTYAFHHLNNEQKVMAIKEMFRVLKDQGKIVIGDLMFKDDKDRKDIMSKLSAKQIEEIEDEYYSNIDFLTNELKKLNKKLKYVKIDYINYIIQI